MFQKAWQKPLDLSAFRGEKFKAQVLEELLAMLIEKELPALIEKAKKARRRLPIPKQDVAALKRDFAKRCEPDIQEYKELIWKRLEGMLNECLGKIKDTPKDVYNWKRDRWLVKAETFNVDQWLFDRGKWRTILSEDNSMLMGAVLIDSSQQTMDWIGIGSAFNVIDKDALKLIAANARNAAWSITDTTYDKIKQTLLEAVADGLSIPHIRDKIKEYFEVSKYRGELIARTETLRATNRGNLLAMQKSGVVVAKKWLTTDDDRTCPECMQMDGRTVEVEKNFFDQGATFGSMNLDYEDIEAPPLHPDCRCTMLAEFNPAAPEWKINDQEAGHIIDESVTDGYEAVHNRIEAGYKYTYGKNPTKEEVDELLDAMQKFTYGNASSVLRKVQIGNIHGISKSDVEYFKKVSDRLEQYIKIAPKFKKGEPLYRGITKSGSQSCIDFYEAIKNSPAGSEISFASTSHWTTAEEIGAKFDGKIMFVLNETKMGTSVNYMIPYEEEVAISRIAKYKILKREMKDKRLMIWLKEL